MDLKYKPFRGWVVCSQFGGGFPLVLCRNGWAYLWQVQSCPSLFDFDLVYFASRSDAIAAIRPEWGNSWVVGVTL